MPWPWSRRTADAASEAGWIEEAAWTAWEAPRNYIAGEASYAKALSALTGQPCADGYCRAVVVRLVREPGNQYDPNALRALIGRNQIGYLRRHVAATLAPALDAAGHTWIEVPGLLRGGSTTGPNVGCHIWLARCLAPSGVEITLPHRDPRWEVKWPLHPWELAQVRPSP